MPRPPGLATALILKAIADGYRYGLDIVDATGRPSGTVYPTLGRLEKRGMVAGRWEDPAVSEEARRPRRRYYELTDDGEDLLLQARRLFGGIGWQAGSVSDGARVERA